MKDPNLEIHVLREEKNIINEEIKGILVIDTLIDTKILLTQLRQLLETAKKFSFLIKWHYSLTKKLEQTTENKKFLFLLKLFEENKTIEILEEHFCDDYSNKYNENNTINCINYIFNEIMEKGQNNIFIYFLNTDGQMNTKFIENCKEKNIQIMNLCKFLDQKMIE
uniref:TASOR PIN domain-containing protein n=1 Tax=Meloidogyne incognita TaxID=6306 RepID=A0A914N0T9_MELIC